MRSRGLQHHNNCSRCPVIGAEDVRPEEFFTLLALRFNVRIAQELCEGHTPVLVDERGLRRWLKRMDINPTHLDHLPSDLGPGIEVTLPAGCGAPLIDGNHRAARALRDGTPFFAYVLTEAETLELLRRTMGVAIADDYWRRIAASQPHPDDLVEEGE